MTVREVISWLKDFDEDMEVVIGQRQRYGTDFAYGIHNIAEQIYEGFWSGSSKVVSINMDEQMGTIIYDADPDDYDEDEYDEDDWDEEE